MNLSTRLDYGAILADAVRYGKLDYATAQKEAARAGRNTLECFELQCMLTEQARNKKKEGISDGE